MLRKERKSWKKITCQMMLVSWYKNLRPTLERGNIINYFNDLVCTILLILMNLKSIFKGKSLNHKLRVVTGIAAFYKNL